jgi:hypothetical protein
MLRLPAIWQCSGWRFAVALALVVGACAPLHHHHRVPPPHHSESYESYEAPVPHHDPGPPHYAAHDCDPYRHDCHRRHGYHGHYRHARYGHHRKRHDCDWNPNDPYRNIKFEHGCHW